MLVAGFLEFKFDYSEKNIHIGAVISSSRSSTVQQASTSSGQHSSGRKWRPVRQTAQATWLHGSASSGPCFLLLQGTWRSAAGQGGGGAGEVADQVWERTGDLRAHSGAGRVSGAAAERASRS